MNPLRNRGYIYLFLLPVSAFVILSSPLHAAGEGISIQADVNPPKGTVGTSFDYTLTLGGEGADKLSITLPAKGDVFPGKESKSPGKDTSSPDVVPVYSIEDAGQETGRQAGIIRYHIRLTYFRPGTYRLPEIDIRGADGIAVGYKVPGVQVESVNPSGEMQDVEPPLDITGGWMRIVVFILLFLAVAGAALYFIIRYLKKRKKDVPVVVLEPIEVFRREIESLACEKLIREGRAKEYAQGISMAFRDFLSALYGMDALEMTTDELRVVLKPHLSAAQRSAWMDEIMDCFSLWDLSKYAEFAPSEELLTRNLDLTCKLAGILGTGRLNV